jgi:hypothetical protein
MFSCVVQAILQCTRWLLHVPSERQVKNKIKVDADVLFEPFFATNLSFSSDRNFLKT